jgi:hypothetical protein
MRFEDTGINKKIENPNSISKSKKPKKPCLAIVLFAMNPFPQIKPFKRIVNIPFAENVF